MSPLVKNAMAAAVLAAALIACAAGLQLTFLLAQAGETMADFRRDGPPVLERAGGALGELAGTIGVLSLIPRPTCLVKR